MPGVSARQRNGSNNGLTDLTLGVHDFTFGVRDFILEIRDFTLGVRAILVHVDSRMSRNSRSIRAFAISRATPTPLTLRFRSCAKTRCSTLP